MIQPTRDANAIKKFFPDPWFEERLKILMSEGRTFFFILDGDKSGCSVTVFDGMGTLAHLWTWPQNRNKGYAQRLVLEVAEYWHHAGPRGKQHIPILARYRSDEKHIHKLFTKMGYEVVHEGHDNFMVVMARSLRGAG